MVYEFKPLQIVQNESLRACTYIGKCRTFWLKDKAPHVLPFATRLPKQRDEKKYKKAGFQIHSCSAPIVTSVANELSNVASPEKVNFP